MLRKIKNFSDNGQWRMSYAYKTDLTKGVLQWDSHINRKNSMGHYIFARILFSWITSFFVFFRILCLSIIVLSFKTISYRFISVYHISY